MDQLFGLRSVLLLIAFIQGFVFAVLLVVRGQRKKQVQDYFLAGLLFALATSLISYIIGFMGIYDKAREEGWDLTYFPFGNALLFGPLILLYVRALTDREYRWQKSEWWHFVAPLILYVRCFVLWAQPYPTKQWWEIHFGWESMAWDVVVYVFTTWYLYKSWMRLRDYRTLLQHEYSNYGARTLEWLRAFLIASIVYFAFALAIDLAGLLFNFFYTEYFYSRLLLAGMIYYISLSGWNFAQKSDMPFEQIERRETQVIEMEQTEKSNALKSLFTSDELATKRIELSQFMEKEKPWLDPELTLSDLAAQFQLNPVQLSALVNNGIGKNFNDFVNEYRVEAIKKRLDEGASKQFSLLGIAYECGFNSKATFNRAFKKHAGVTPGEYKG